MSAQNFGFPFIDVPFNAPDGTISHAWHALIVQICDAIKAIKLIWNPCVSLYDRRPDAGEILMDITLSYDVTLPVGLISSGGGINTPLNGAAAATGDSVFTIYKDGVSIGTATIPAATTGIDIAVFSFAASVTIPKGHSFQFQAPMVQDATLQGISFSFLGTRT